MNYLEIVLHGFFNENNREYMERYFFREFKKAEKEQHFEADEFFSGCLKVIEIWEKSLQAQIHKRKMELYELLTFAKIGKAAERDGQGFQQTIDDCKNALRDVRPDGIGSQTFTIHLNSITNGRITHNMTLNEALQIKGAIHKAFKRASYEPVTNTGVDANTPKLTLRQIALKYVYEGVQITRENANEIAKQYGHTSGEKLFQHYTYFSSATNRKGKPTLYTFTKLSNKIKLFESVIAILPTDKQQRAVDELGILKGIIETEYL